MEFFKTRPSKITEGLFLGNSEDAKDLELLKELEVKYILIAGNCLTMHFPKVIIQRLCNLRYLNINNYK